MLALSIPNFPDANNIWQAALCYLAVLSDQRTALFLSTGSLFTFCWSLWSFLRRWSTEFWFGARDRGGIVTADYAVEQSLRRSFWLHHCGLFVRYASNGLPRTFHHLLQCSRRRNFAVDLLLLAGRSAGVLTASF